ncbi:MAG: SurA N-terminal domain-containing protein [Desulfobacterales bacterium]|nr:SurA N-terminal domain-containing protein [Desulfobacterales bacterium]MDL2124666.1 SurA N-terminal domain-containing protein [Deltaproteobacteria bacterium]
MTEVTGKNFRQIFCKVIFCALSFFMTADVQSAEVVDRIVAVVNDDIILLSELDESFKPYADRIMALGYSLDEERRTLFNIREEILNQLIDQKLTDQEIKRSKITVSDNEIDKAIERLKEANLFTDEELREMLKAEGLTMEEYRKRIKDQILRAKLVNFEIKSKIVITKEDIESYYKSHSDKYSKIKEYRLSNIIMKVPSFASEEEKLGVLEKMEMALTELKAGKPFDITAGAYSESSYVSDDGGLGLFKLKELSPRIQKAIKDMKAGEFTPVLDTDQGYQIFYIQEIVNAQGKSLEEASPEIEDILYKEIVDKKFSSWIDELRKRSHIKTIK